MQQQHQGGGRLNLVDPATGQPVQGRIYFTFSGRGMPDQTMAEWVGKNLTLAIQNVLVEQLQSNKIAIPTLAHSVSGLAPEIIAQSGVAQHGVELNELAINVQLDAQPAAMPPDPYQATQQAMQQSLQNELDPRNYEVEAQVNVGGFRVNASTDGGFDTDGLVDQAKSKLVWYAIFAAIGLVVILIIAGVAFYAYKKTMAAMPGGKDESSEAEDIEWNGKKPFSCNGSDHVRITGTKAKLKKGPAVSAMANCRVELIDVEIEAPDGLKALGQAEITMEGGKLHAEKTAAQAIGDSVIILDGVDVEGDTNEVGKNAKVKKK